MDTRPLSSQPHACIMKKTLSPTYITLTPLCKQLPPLPPLFLSSLSLTRSPILLLLTLFYFLNITWIPPPPFYLILTLPTPLILKNSIQTSHNFLPFITLHLPHSSNFHNALPQIFSNPYPTPTPLISPFHSHYTYHSPPTHPPYSTHNPPTHPPYYTKPPPFRPNTKTPNIYSNTPSHKNYKHYKSTSKPCPTPQPLGDPQPSRPKNV